MRCNIHTILPVLLAVLSKQIPDQIDQTKVVLHCSKHELSFLYYQIYFKMTIRIRNVALNSKQSLKLTLFLVFYYASHRSRILRSPVLRRYQKGLGWGSAVKSLTWPVLSLTNPTMESATDRDLSRVVNVAP
jgi:hypothetical protein